MARPSPQPAPENRQQLFSESADPSMLSGQFWAKLFRYRPLLLLGVFWLTLICISAVAYSRLMFSGVPIDSASRGAVAPRRSAPPPVIMPAPRGADSSDGAALQPASAAAPEIAPGEVGTVDAGPGPAAGRPKLTWGNVWALFSLVGLCAVGCLIIEHQAKRPPRPKKRRKVVRKGAPHRKPAAVGPPRPKKLAPYSPGRDSMVVPGAPVAPEVVRYPHGPNSTPSARPNAGPGMTTPMAPEQLRSAGQHSPVTADPAHPHPAPLPGAASTTSAEPSLEAIPPESRNPDIVPDDEDHPLDWSEASIAHSLDLRQRRSLSSFM